MKRNFYFIIIIGLVITISPAMAMKNSLSMELTTPGISKTLALPPNASNGTFIYLGTSMDSESGQTVEGYAIIHPKPLNAKGGNGGGGKPDGGGSASLCYSFLAKDAKWKTVEPWIVNTGNLSGLSEAFIFNNLSGNIAKWEDAADGVVNDTHDVDIIGNGTSTNAVLTADTVSPDGANEVYFANISDPGVIGVTIVWGIFGGNPSNRKLVEWDQVYDDIDFDWSDSGETNKMDFENIATHELGHTVGLADLYDVNCSAETMYGFASEGDINGRDLNTGDITGINKLY